MRIAVIAASGRSGQAFVAEALAAGHTVRAGIRGNDQFAPQEGLVTVECDATDISQVTALIEHCDAVVSLIGHVKGSDALVQTTAITTVIRAMEASGIQRIVSLTGVGVGSKGALNQIIVRLLSQITVWVGIDRLKDGLAHAKVLERSSLEWTVVKVLLLSDGEPGKFSLKTRGIVKAPTPRREVAQAILRILEEKSFIREFPIIARP